MANEMHVICVLYYFMKPEAMYANQGAHKSLNMKVS